MFKVADLEDRYGIVRSGIYTRLKRLNIVPRRIGRNTYLDEVQLDLMDRLDDFLARGGTMEEFAVLEGVSDNNLPLQVSGLECFQALEEACQQHWLLATSQVATLLQISPTNIDEHLPRFSDGGFSFTRQGQRLSGEAAWRVTKEEMCSCDRTNEFCRKQRLTNETSPAG
ncbi:hypothetical protein IFO70_32475 [Phormidium tenue FACHB-886]|nr:hypothetical protein [Phormidium tenue FACHB-886]